MQSLWVNIGKAAQSLKKEGVRVTGRRVLRAASMLLSHPGSGDVLFVTGGGGVGDSARYRCHHHAEELRLHGLQASVTVQDHPLLLRSVDQFSVFVFHRPLMTPALANVIEKMKAQEKEIIFETDDLLFDPEYLKHSDYVQKANVLEKKLYENGMGADILDDPYVKVCTTTTAFLAEKLRERGKRVCIVPNKLSQEDVAWAQKIIDEKLAAEASSDKKGGGENQIKLGYFSGTPSHDKDFATLADALVNLLQKYSFVRLVLAGPIATESRLRQYADRIDILPFAPRREHFKNISRVDMNLVPLEVGNPFCEAKSELKFFEAGIVGVPTVAAATQTFREAIEDGVDGFTAGTTEEWTEKIERLITDKALRVSMGEKARRKALACYTTEKANNQEYYQYLSSKTKRI